METAKEFPPPARTEEGADGAKAVSPEHIAVHIVRSPQEVTEFLTAIHVHEISEVSFSKLTGIFTLLSLPVTVLCEERYEDEVYRDTYYAYFARKFSRFDRDCKRLSFFEGVLKPEAFCDYGAAAENLLRERFRGVFVFKPTRYGVIGRTFLAPEKLRLPTCYLRTASFSFFVLGHRLSLECFPYSSQDTETMTCAEITIWSIMEYFGTAFSGFRTALPSQITAELEKHSYERALPSRGSEYSWMSAIFKTFGFAPRLYDRRAFADDEKQRREFKKLFHYYVESGIPVAVGIRGKKRGEELRHSVVCIGHGARKRQIQAPEVCYMGNETVYPYIDSAFLYESYVLMDDNQAPYQVASLGNLDGWAVSEVNTFVAPLYPQVFLEAGDVSALISAVFTDDCMGIAGLVPEFGERVDQNNPLILRVFLAQSGEYQGFRAKNAETLGTAAFYGSLRLPPYVWAAEISTYAAYQSGKIYGEIVIDATAGRSDQLDSLIMIRYLDHLGFRTPEESPVYAIDKGLKCRTRGLRFPYAMYRNNLTECGGRKTNGNVSDTRTGT